jgi:hypothetical protein
MPDLRINCWNSYKDKRDGWWSVIIREYVQSRNKRTGRPFTKFIGYVDVPLPANEVFFPTREAALQAAQAKRDEVIAARYKFAIKPEVNQ